VLASHQAFHDEVIRLFNSAILQLYSVVFFLIFVSFLQPCFEQKVQSSQTIQFRCIRLRDSDLLVQIYKHCGDFIFACGFDYLFALVDEFAAGGLLSP